MTPPAFLAPIAASSRTPRTPRSRAYAWALLLPVLLTTLLLTALRPAIADAARPSTARIVNGEPVDAPAHAARWASIASLTVRGERDARRGHQCGGVFIAPRLVATAAHCIVDPNRTVLLEDNGRLHRYNNTRPMDFSKLQVVAGRRVLSSNDGERIDIAHVVIHPRYDPITNRNDVALLRLKRAPAASSGVVPVLPVQEGEDGIWGAGAGIGTSAAAGPWVAGWGERFVPADAMFFSGAQHSPILRPTTPKPRPTRYKNARTSSRSTARAGRSLSNTLMQAAVPIQSDARCELGSMGIAKDIGMGIDFDPASMLCAGKLDTADRNDLNTTTDGVDSCYGDSGGPLLATVGGALRLVGLVSFGTGCATRDSFGVYTRVASMRSFLNRPVRRAVTLKQRPRVAGAKRIGGMLRCHRGSWGGAGPLRFSYRWVTPYDDTLGVSFEFGESWERLPRSGTRATYRIKPDDRGREIACMVIASNSSSTMVRPSLKVQVPGKRPVDPEAEPEGGSEEDMPSGMPLG